MDEPDVIVIGAGPAGEVVAGRCADAGLSVVIAERELVGGECSYWACIPSKTLLRPGDVLASARRVPGAAEAVAGPVDAGPALKRRDWMVSGYDDSGQLPWLSDRDIRLVRGTARLDGERTVTVTSDDGGSETIRARKAVVVATGSSSAMPHVPGLAASTPWSTRDATGLTSVPQRLAVLGGGPVGVELAQAIKRLGAREVTVIDTGDHLLAREEPFAGEAVQAGLEADGIRVLLHARAQRVDRRPDGSVRITLEGAPDLEADELLVATGRIPRTEDIGLETVGLSPGEPVAADDRLRARGVGGNWLYAVGDCTGIVLLTHMGKYQARIAADVILGNDVRDRASHDIVPRVTFTDPHVAAVGLTEAEARERGLEVRAVSVPLESAAAAAISGDGVAGTVQLVLDADGTVLGATFVGPEIEELMHSATIAIAGKVRMADLYHAVPAFPSISEVWLHLLEAAEKPENPEK